MIVRAIMEALKALVLFILGLFPDLPEFTFLEDFAKTFAEIVQSVNAFVDIKVLGVCLVCILLCCHARAIWSVVIWVIRKIPGES